MQSTDPLAKTLREWIGIFMRQSMQSFFQYSKQSGLSMAQIGALFQILHKGSSGVTDLGEEMGVTSAAASQMLERLVQQKLVSRSEDAHDRRVKIIVLTDKGRTVLQGSIDARQAWLDELVSQLTEAEKEQVETGMRILVEKGNQTEQLKEKESQIPLEV